MMKRIDGKSIEVKKLVIDSTGEQLNILLNVFADGNSLALSFSNVNNFKIDGVSCPFVIAGFEIIDNKDKGWESHSRYTVSDYEDGILKFYCEDIEIKELYA